MTQYTIKAFRIVHDLFCIFGVEWAGSYRHHFWRRQLDAKNSFTIAMVDLRHYRFPRFWSNGGCSEAIRTTLQNHFNNVLLIVSSPVLIIALIFSCRCRFPRFVPSLQHRFSLSSPSLLTVCFHNGAGVAMPQ